MILYTPRALGQIDRLRLHYLKKNRPEAARALDRALDQAEEIITQRPGAGLPAPRPYPELARPGRSWTQAGRYWIAYRTGAPAVILAVFHDGADIPRRI